MIKKISLHYQKKKEKLFINLFLFSLIFLLKINTIKNVIFYFNMPLWMTMQKLLKILHHYEET